MEQEKSLIEKVRFYLSDPNKVAEALILIRNTEKIIEEAKEKVKERAVEIMDRENKDVHIYSITDKETGEIREWEIRRDYGSQTKKYKAEIVLKILGEKAIKFLDVKKTDIDKFLKRESAKGEISMSDIEEITKVENCVISVRKGSGVKMREIKPTK